MPQFDGIQTSQKNSNVKIKCNGISDDDSIVIRADIREKISELFLIKVIIQSKKSGIDTGEIINKPACITILNPDETERCFAGMVMEASLENIPTYEEDNIRASNILCLTIVPTLFKLSLTRKCRIFQELSVIEIIDKVLKENGISNVKKSISSAGQDKQTFCVQYNESDLHFLERLMESNGIFYYFTHAEDGDTFCMSDSNSSSAKKISPELLVKKHYTSMYYMDAIYNITSSSSLGIKKVTSLSFSEDKFAPVSGKTEDSGVTSNIGEFEIFDDVFVDSSVGDKISKTIVESENREIATMTANSSCPNIYPGCLVSIKQSGIESQNGNFFVIESKHVVNNIASKEDKIPFYENKIRLVPEKTKFRPPIKRNKPRIYGVQTATVTGPSGEEIFCDDNGRIKIRFHWDSRSEEDDNSSCWIRVAQSWAGKNFGGLVIPRVKMEVLVVFINGDPDQPIVTGCIYNGVNKPPAEYPKKQKTVSTFYTDSSKDHGGYNELRFDDNKEKEEIYIHAQKDMNTIVENSVTETLNEGSKTITLESKKDEVSFTTTIKKGDSITTIDKGNSTTTIKEGDMTVTLEKGSQTVTLKEGDQTISLKKGNMTIDVKGDISIHADNISVKADGTFSVNSKKAMSHESMDSATFKTTKDFSVDSSMKASITAKMNIDIESKMDITEKGLNINRTANVGIKDKANATLTIESSAMATFKANAMMDINGGAMTKVAGGMIKLN